MFSRNKVAVLVAEVIGTGLLTSVVLSVSRSAIGLPYFVALAAGMTLGLMVLVIGSTSGSHINPAVTFGLWTARKVPTLQAIAYIAAQFLGAVFAWRLYTYLTNSNLQNLAGTAFDWRIFIAEAVGTMVFTFGLAAAVWQKLEGGKQAFAIGASLTAGILVASVASNGILNPAVALGIQSWSLTYAVAPLVGALVGVNLYSLLFAGDKIKIARSTTGKKRK